MAEETRKGQSVVDIIADYEAMKKKARDDAATTVSNAESRLNEFWRGVDESDPRFHLGSSGQIESDIDMSPEDVEKKYGIPTFDDFMSDHPELEGPKNPYGDLKGAKKVAGIIGLFLKNTSPTGRAEENERKRRLQIMQTEAKRYALDIYTAEVNRRKLMYDKYLRDQEYLLELQREKVNQQLKIEDIKRQESVKNLETLSDVYRANTAKPTFRSAPAGTKTHEKKLSNSSRFAEKTEKLFQKTNELGMIDEADKSRVPESQMDRMSAHFNSPAYKMQLMAEGADPYWTYNYFTQKYPNIDVPDFETWAQGMDHDTDINTLMDEAESTVQKLRDKNKKANAESPKDTEGEPDTEGRPKPKPEKSKGGSKVSGGYDTDHPAKMVSGRAVKRGAVHKNLFVTNPYEGDPANHEQITAYHMQLLKAFKGHPVAAIATLVVNVAHGGDAVSAYEGLMNNVDQRRFLHEFDPDIDIEDVLEFIRDEINEGVYVEIDETGEPKEFPKYGKPDEEESDEGDE